MSNAYKNAGVDIEKGYESVELIKKHIKATENLGAIEDFGGFGGIFNLFKYNYKEPVLVSGTDGVGTKLLLAIDSGKYDEIGVDLVAMCVNDVLTCGARPLFFLDYLAVNKNEPTKIEELVKGVSKGCLMSECALIGGETAEMPGLYEDKHFDMAGFTVGVVEKEKRIDNSKLKANDVIIGLKSSGIHSNGYSLVRKILADNNIDYMNEDFEGKPLINKLLSPTKIYVKPVLRVLDEIDVHAMAHITGGGFYENIPRVLGELGCKIKKGSWDMDSIFPYLQNLADIKEKEMYNVFNMSIGFILIVDEKDVSKTLDILKNNNEEAFVIGEITDTKGVEMV
ncbi:MAG: phosphoribosylformylglycinamidine cyclo-ligase [Lachnospirales bacterium]